LIPENRLCPNSSAGDLQPSKQSVFPRYKEKSKSWDWISLVPCYLNTPGRVSGTELTLKSIYWVKHHSLVTHHLV
jgi:hypothetical protein